MSKAKSAIGIVRVSQVRGREGDSFVSPSEQRQRIKAECKRRDLRLAEIVEELDVSGGASLRDRHGLRRAVEAVEVGEAQVIVAAYFDRLVRSLRVQDELVSRVEEAGGSVLAVDVGRVTNGSAAQWLSSTMLGGFAEYQRRVTAERVAEAQRRAVARGVAPWRYTTPGYTRNEDGIFTPNKTAPAVAKAFRMRGEGASVRECRTYLARHGVKRTMAAVSRLFHDRAVLGELHFGDLHNPNAHTAIVTPEAFRRAGAASAPRGRTGKSDRLLARLGVLRCATCGARMVAGTSNNGTTPTYRCPSKSDCPRGVVVSAKIAEAVVTEAVRDALRNVEGRASVEANAAKAEQALDRTQAELDAAIRAFTGLEDEPAARERLAELREARDVAQERVEQLGDRRTIVTISADRDWDRLTLDERRDLIRATVARAIVAPGGRGAGRVTVELVGE
jgi:DNA invertase Pin-like site-specific DNA recombinase